MLPTTGTYTVQVFPYQDYYAELTTTFSGQVLVTADVSATLATNGTATAVSLAQAGQTARVTFSGTAGQDWVLYVSALTMKRQQSVPELPVYRPDGTQVTGGNCYPTGTDCAWRSMRCRPVAPTR